MCWNWLFLCVIFRWFIKEALRHNRRRKVWCNGRQLVCVGERRAASFFFGDEIYTSYYEQTALGCQQPQLLPTMLPVFRLSYIYFVAVVRVLGGRFPCGSDFIRFDLVRFWPITWGNRTYTCRDQSPTSERFPAQKSDSPYVGVVRVYAPGA